MEPITQHEYWKEVESISNELQSEALQELLDGGAEREDIDSNQIWEIMADRLHETIDGHQWIIYTYYNYQVLQHSPNDGYSAENFGTESIVDKSGNLNTAALAFGALYGDVSEYIWNHSILDADEVE